jgi:hypothetical protein
MKHQSMFIISAVVLMLGLTGCGGGGGGGGAPPPAPSGSSNWDTMVWDQDNWL